MQVSNIDKAAVNKMQEREQALNGWIIINAAGNTTAKGKFSGIKVQSGEDAVLSLVFKADSPCNMNGEATIALVQGDYLPTRGLISATIIAGAVFLIKEEYS